MLVREMMNTPAITVREDCSLEDAAREMVTRKIGCLPVVNEQDELCGIVTASDFCAKEKGVPFSLIRLPQVLGEWMPEESVERIYEAARRTAVSEIMSRNLVSLTPDETLETVLQRMLESGVHHLPVVEDRKVIGIVARRDLLRVMLARLS
jgi:CBS domain-containing protein